MGGERISGQATADSVDSGGHYGTVSLEAITLGFIRTLRFHCGSESQTASVGQQASCIPCPSSLSDLVSSNDKWKVGQFMDHSQRQWASQVAQW